MILAIDCGNTRIKWGRFANGRLTGKGAASLRDGDAYAALADAFAGDVDRVVIANVAGPAVAARVESVVTSRLGLRPEFARVEASAHGIVCAYREPGTLGVDRWLAMIAARAQVGGLLAVVGAGTAVTFDGVLADGRHLGGLILPGDRLMLEALAAHTVQIGSVAPVSTPVAGLDLFGRSTAEAVGRGSRLAVAAAIDRAVAVLAESQGTAPRLLVTGGDAGTLVPWLASPAEVRADLVLEGLAVIAGARE